LEPAVSGKALRAPILAAAARTGEPPPVLAERAGVPPSIAIDPDARVPHSMVAGAWDVLAAHAGDPHLGLSAALLLDAAPLDLLDVALGAAPTLGALIDAYLRYQRLFHDGNASSLVVTGDRALAAFALRGVARSRHLTEFVLGSWCRRMQRLVGPRFAPIEIHLKDRDASHPLFQRVFAAPVVAGAPADAIVLPAALLETPLAGADVEVVARLAPQLDRALGGEPIFEARAAEHLRRVLAQLGPRTDTSALARAMGTSTRTLQRRLAERGTRFGELLDRVRRERALAELERPDASVTEIAFVVGFADPSAFGRAFRRWTGTTPARHRRRRPDAP
jgi:AraC-like DNA-binding protein